MYSLVFDAHVQYGDDARLWPDWLTGGRVMSQSERCREEQRLKQRAATFAVPRPACQG
jgi:hypothetical protein